MEKIALIAGITGQDGFYLTQYLLQKNYKIYGIIRRKSSNDIGNLVHLTPEQMRKVTICEGDVLDFVFLRDLIKSIQADEIYHLAGQSFVKYSFSNPIITFQTNFFSTLYFLESIRLHSAKSKFFFACTSETFGNSNETPLRIESKMDPVSPYGISKLSAFLLVKQYRRNSQIFAVSGVSFNHESEFRGEEFVTRKISKFVANYEKTLEGVLEIGNLHARRDWGHSEDYVKGFWLSLQQKEPKDYVFATGTSFSVKDFINAAFKLIGRELEWQGESYDEKAIDIRKNTVVVRVDTKLLRPQDIENLKGDTEHTRKTLGWVANIQFEELVRRMVQNDRKGLL